jgi:membrane-associated phospholipid phosphatase
MVLALLLAASTLTTKQHFIADVLSGFALAALACCLTLQGGPPGDPVHKPLRH